MEGLDAAITKMTNAWQNLISKIANGNTFKGLINVVTGLLKWLGKGNSLLKLVTIAFTLFNTKTLLTNLRLAQSGEKVRNLNTLLDTFKNKITSVGTNLASLTTTTYTYADALGKAATNQERLNVATSMSGYSNLKVKNTIKSTFFLVLEYDKNLEFINN